MKNDLQMPKDFSLICAESDPSFEFSQPSVAHIQRNTRPISGRIVQWAENVVQGKEDCQKGFSEAEFIEGGTVGTAPITNH